MDLSTNAAQANHWTHVTGPVWVQRQQQLDAQLAPFGELARSALRPRAGEAILDVGCGCGSESLRLAQCVGASGRVLGVDISSTMLTAARDAANAGKVANVEFRTADAQNERLNPGTFDAAFSRFGVMFFDDPVKAFGNIHATLTATGRLGFICWAELEENPWMGEIARAVAQYVDMPPPPPPGTPGPFGLCDPDRTRRILSEAGFKNVQLSPVGSEMLIAGGGPVQAAVDLMMSIGPAAAALREPRPNAPDLRPVLTSLFQRYITQRGVVMPSKAWLVTANR